MKSFLNRFIHPGSFLSGKPAMGRHEELLSDVQSPAQRAMVTAFIACMLTLMLVYWITHKIVAQLEIWWVEGLLYVIFPITVTFVLLYRSCWHRETMGWSRTGSLLMLSCAIFGGVLLAIGLVVALAAFCVIAARICEGAR